jgi:hypothetical protein
MLWKLLNGVSAIILMQSLSAQVVVDRVWFRACANGRNCSEVTRLEPGNKTLEVGFTIRNIQADNDDYFVLATTEYIVAPMTIYSVKDFDRLRREVSWARIVTQGDDMAAVVVRGLRPGTKRELAIRAFDPASLTRNFSDGSDNLWPWLARVTILVMDQKGQLLASGNAVLEIEPTRLK